MLFMLGLIKECTFCNALQFIKKKYTNGIRVVGIALQIVGFNKRVSKH